jgi:hypothetical protein
LSVQLANGSLQTLHVSRCPRGVCVCRTPLGSPFRLPGKLFCSTNSRTHHIFARIVTPLLML